jgi:hypothetical protein
MFVKPALGQAFGVAFCQHFGLPTGQVMKVTPHVEQDEILHAKVEIFLTADDLAGIAMRMGAAGVGPEQPSVLGTLSVDVVASPAGGSGR